MKSFIKIKTIMDDYKNGLIEVIKKSKYYDKEIEELDEECLEEIVRQVYKNYAEEKNLDYSIQNPNNRAFVMYLFHKEKFQISMW